ncbi:MAG: hypothetical protein ACREV4_16285, partial [Gammaproteobacteria bacterium]
IHPDQTRSVPSNFGADQARLYRTAQQNKENQITSYFSDTTLAGSDDPIPLNGTLSDSTYVFRSVAG